MATFGFGNFDSDAAAEHLGDLCKELISQVETAMSDPRKLEPDEYWADAVPCVIEILLLLNRHDLFGSELPGVSTAERWKETFMNTWLENVNKVYPDEEFQGGRKKVLLRTFAKLIRRAKIDEAN